MLRQLFENPWPHLTKIIPDIPVQVSTFEPNILVICQRTFMKFKMQIFQTAKSKNPSLKNVIFTCLFKMLNHLRFLSKNWSSIKSAMRRNSSLKNRLVCIKKEKTELNVTAECKMVDAYETNTHYRRILVTPRRTNASDIFWRLLLRFIVIYLLQSLFSFSKDIEISAIIFYF
jgi:hypothetical protein